MPFGSIVIQQNPVVSNPNGGKFNLSLMPTGLVRMDPLSYKHVNKVTGGFYSCKFDILGPKINLDEMYDNGLAREVRTYNHQGLVGWQGLITATRQTTQDAQRMVTLEKTLNKVTVRYTQSRGRRTMPDPVENIASQNAYGILEHVEDLDIPTKSSAKADSLAALIESDLSDPYRLKEFRARGDRRIPNGMAKLTIFCQGYWWYLARRLYNKQTRSSANASTVVAAVITAAGQFVASSSVETNTQQSYQQFDNDDLAWDVLVGQGETGDTSDDRFIIGMYEDRKLIYEKRAAATLPNIRLWRNNQDMLTDRSGREIAGMTLRPDKFLRDTRIGNRPGKVYSSVWDDPQVTYVGSVEYSEADQNVRLQSEVPVPRQLAGISGGEGGGGRRRRRKGKRGPGKLRWKDMSQEERDWWTSGRGK